MKRLLSVSVVLLLCFSLLGSLVAVGMNVLSDRTYGLTSVRRTPSVDFLAEQDKTFRTSLPNSFYDFTNSELESTFANMFHMTHTYKDGEYITFHITDDDPYTWIRTPGCTTGEAKYVRIAYRTTVPKIGEFYCTRSDNGAMGSTGTTFEFRYKATGEWEESIYPCTAWMDAPEKTAFEIFRFDPLAGGNKSGETIDVKYFAFFSSEKDAEDFDFDEYLAKLAYDKEQAEQELSKPVNWPDPPFREMETTDKDTYDGSLTYTPSSDGKQVTISYQVNGETRSCTVPNEQNYLFGGYAGMDDLNRPLYTAGDVGIYGEKGEHYVGLFYFLWHGEHGDNGVFDLQKIINEKGELAKDVAKGGYGPVGAMHWFAEPLYGYYYANDAWVMRKHAELLCNANVDFLYFDVTNGFTYLHNAMQLMSILHELNEQGFHAPQVVFYTHSNAATVVRQLYQAIYKKNLYPDTWFRIGGKPVIIAPESANIDNFFCTKNDQWPTEATKPNAWPWMDFVWPQRIFDDQNGKPSCVSVSIAQHSGTVRFSDSSLYGCNTNRGRSFYASRPSPSHLKKQRELWEKDPSLTMQGRNFQAQWDRAIEADVPFALVTGWNEWVAQRQPGKQVIFVDTASMEFSRDSEMMRGGYFDNYYMQLAYNIQKFKGTAPIIVQDSRRPINVTGGFDQWDDVPVRYADPSGDTADRDAIGFGHTPYKDTSGRNDIVSAKVTSDTKHVYFYVETVHDVSLFDTESSWMQLFVNTDSQNTGFYGYDYIINHEAKGAFKTTVARCVSKDHGPTHEYNFETVGEVSYRAKGNRMMIAVPLDLLGIEDYRTIRIEFKWVDSDTRITTMEQMYSEGDAAPLGRFNYIYQNYIPGVSVIEPEETETEAPTDQATEAPTAPPTEAPTDPVTEAPTSPAESVPSSDTEAPVEKKGCQSLVGSVSASLLLLTVPAVLYRKRKTRR